MFSIISVAFGGYERFIPEFVEWHKRFSDDIIIETERAPMGEMRNRAAARARHDFIISLDIDDMLLSQPDIFSGFTGLGWVENGKVFDYWLPGEERSANQTIRSNIMFSKEAWRRTKFAKHDYYIYDLLEKMYRKKVPMARTNNACVLYRKRSDSLSARTDDAGHAEADKMLNKLMGAVRPK